MSHQTEKAHEGLMTAEDYKPEAIGEAAITAGEPEQTWPQYGLEMVPILHNGDDTGRRFIRQNGNYIADVTDSYQLLPNEQVVEAANDVAQELGAEPFHQFDGDWFIQLDDHVYQDPERRRVHALYAWESGTVGGDSMEYGFAVHNSIDGSLGFNVALFSFRHACANMVHIGVNNSMAQRALNVEGERDVLASSSHRHTSGLEVDTESLAARVKGTLMFVDNIDETYNAWHDSVVNDDHVEALIQRLPEKDLPDWVQDTKDRLEDEAEDYADEEDVDIDILPADQKASVIEANIPTGETIWETYNDVTQAVWHDNRTADTSKQRKMRQVHRAFPLGDGLK